MKATIIYNVATRESENTISSCRVKNYKIDSWKITMFHWKIKFVFGREENIWEWKIS